ncbi:hypothetical protein GBAR_LOCUS8669 [Geodia barretti]|uniref:Uncharacterized protein n=1 Tax=Geodia barretti TaxID=519541 RepID=A0AA35RN03_GEOBA|nr:hypothetical protein GBAR_LOCUS8669 [Geodia barretti]
MDQIDIFSHSGRSELMPTLYTTTGSPERGYQSVLTTSENDTVNTIIYRCTATVSSYSNFSETIVHVKDGGNGEDTYFMPTSSSIANTNDDNFEIVTSTATTITPKSTIAKGEPIKQSHWLSAFFTFQIWSNVLKQSLSQPRSLLLPSVKYVHVKMLTRSHVLRALQ